MNKLMLLLGVVLLTIPSPFAGKNNASPSKNKLIVEKSEENRQLTPRETIQLKSDSICRELGIPAQLVREIGQNESGWQCIRSFSGGTDYGDLQVVESTFNYWYDRLELEGGKTRENYLIVGINYLKYLHDRYGSWEKARFAYARGHWRDRSTWTCLEVKFMDKINWRQYDV